MAELISHRTESSKTFDLGGQRRGLDCSIGAIHYKDNYADTKELWKDIDLTWEGNRITKSPYELTLEGNKATVKDKKTGGVSSIELLEIGGILIPPQAWERSKGLAKAFATDLEVVAGNGSVSFTRILKSSQAPIEAKYRITGNIPLRVRASDGEGELPVEWSIKDGVLTETLKPNRPVKYPVRIDPTLDPQVGASADDASQREWDGLMLLTEALVRNNSNADSAARYWGGYRFVSAEFPAQGTTIDVAYLRVYVYDTGYDDANFNIHFEELAAPAAFAIDAGNITGRDRTENSVPWVANFIAAGGVGWYNSPSLLAGTPNSPVEELWAAYSPTVIVVITRPNQDAPKALYVYSYDYNDNTKGAILHLEWTVGGVTHYGAATLAGVGTLAGIGRGIFVGKSTLSGIGTLAAIGRGIFVGAATLAGTGTLSALGGLLLAASATLSGVGSLSAIAGVWKLGAATLSGVGSLAAKGVGIFAGKATLTGVGSLAAAGRGIFVGSATLAGTGTLNAIGLIVAVGRLLKVVAITSQYRGLNIITAQNRLIKPIMAMYRKVK